MVGGQNLYLDEQTEFKYADHGGGICTCPDGQEFEVGVTSVNFYGEDTDASCTSGYRTGGKDTLSVSGNYMVSARALSPDLTCE